MFRNVSLRGHVRWILSRAVLSIGNDTVARSRGAKDKQAKELDTEQFILTSTPDDDAARNHFAIAEYHLIFIDTLHVRIGFQSDLCPRFQDAHRVVRQLGIEGAENVIGAFHDNHVGLHIRKPFGHIFDDEVVQFTTELNGRRSTTDNDERRQRLSLGIGDESIGSALEQFHQPIANRSCIGQLFEKESMLFHAGHMKGVRIGTLTTNEVIVVQCEFFLGVEEISAMDLIAFRIDLITIGLIVMEI